MFEETWTKWVEKIKIYCGIWQTRCNTNTVVSYVEKENNEKKKEKNTWKKLK